MKVIRLNLLIFFLIVLSFYNVLADNLIESEFLDAVQRGDIETVSSLLNNISDINIKDNKGRTAIHLSAIKGYKKLTELLISNGADINPKDMSGWTPLHLAVDQ